MSLQNNRNIFLGSIIQSLNKRLVLGDIDTKAVAFVGVVVKYIEYGINQYNAGNEEHVEDIKNLNAILFKLKHICPDVCILRNKIE